MGLLLCEKLYTIMDKECAALLPRKEKDVVKEVVDVKEVRSRKGKLYRRFLIQWLGKPSAES